ncbi:uncharacterized protein J4E79_005556 [Alternaria viburni]|uniref:uncharacterized protein n=1 Tax=Alternaria viburni TaxID=566460 RepID=UPI0020C5653C|nr:uncharacterized protein J4E79_005556 [Alternaria viburni]KAI4660988.1 hypothetical protein J4E79_005556 [Alternaria viburni]
MAGGHKNRSKNRRKNKNKGNAKEATEEGPKASDEGKAESSQLPAPTNLKSPIDLPELDTPNTTSSLNFALRKFTPQLSTTDKEKVGNEIGPQTPVVNPAPPRSGFDDWTSPEPDVHNKPEPGPSQSRKSKTTRALGLARATDAAKRLHRVLGIAPPEPFVMPPDMPEGLKEEFEAGLEEYGLDKKMQNMGLDVLSQAAGMQKPLPDKPLFPSPQVEAETWDEGKGKGKGKEPMSTPTAKGKQPMAPIQATVAIQAPSGVEPSSAKKRMSPPGGDEAPGPAPKGSRVDGTTGLPTLPESSSWDIDFPGYTPALLTILLNWSFTVQSFYRRLPNPKAFRAHASFPFPVTAPIYNHLISVGFYDTSVVPHKEIRFLGPGDAAEIAYAEVDVFRGKDERAAFEEQEQKHTKLEEMKKKLKLGRGYRGPGGEATRSQDQYHLAIHGEGRWAYVLIKGHPTSPEDIAPPHIMLAWHISAVTNVSSCLHTVFPEKDTPAPGDQPMTPTSSKQPLRPFASLQNLVSGSRGQKHLHREIRSASSTSELPQVDASSIEPQEGALTLKRTVAKMENAGSIPLVEGFRVDVGQFKGWLDAVGKGTGKLIVWRK